MLQSMVREHVALTIAIADGSSNNDDDDDDDEEEEDEEMSSNDDGAAAAAAKAAAARARKQGAAARTRALTAKRSFLVSRIAQMFTVGSGRTGS
jgi:hypothetical protein